MVEKLRSEAWKSHRPLDAGGSIARTRMEKAWLKINHQSPFSFKSYSRGPTVNLFADSSALAKRYVAAASSKNLDQLLAKATSLGVSVLCLPEIISALCRRRRERLLRLSEYSAAKKALEDDLADAVIIQLVDDVLLDNVRLMELNRLRASDAIQISSARLWQADCSYRQMRINALPQKLPDLM
jgi:predicted nucleic acid-binding protein